MASWLQSLILGIVQGVTEFVPVSSSGHLVLLPYLAGWETHGLAFDVALHMGTLLAVLVYFRKDLWGMLRAVLRRGGDPESVLYRRLAGLLVLGSIPVALTGLLLKPLFEDAFESPLLVSGFLVVTAIVLTVGERVRARRLTSTTAGLDSAHSPSRVWQGDWQGDAEEWLAPTAPAADVEAGRDPADPRGLDLGRMRMRHALIVGIGQAFALVPGLSRSGTTITAGLLAGLTRPAATRFSFLLSLPALFGAALVSLPDLSEPGARTASAGDIAVGVIAAFVAGYVTVSWLIKLVAREKLTVFVRYLLAAAVIGVFGYLMNGPLSSV